MGPSLAEGQIATQDQEPGFGECPRQRHQQGGTTVSAGTVGKDQGVCIGLRGAMQEAANRGLGGGVSKRLDTG